MRPILSPLLSVNQTSLVWAGPAVIPNGLQPNLFPHVLGKGNAVELPPVVMRPMLFPKDKVNHRLPSGPAVMPIGSPLPVGVGNSVMVPTVAQAGAVLRLSRPIETSMAVSSAARCDRRPERFMYLPPLCLTENDLRGTNPSRTGQLTVMLNCWEACTRVLSVTVSVNVNVPFAVGVPLMVVPPFAPGASARPGGTCPAVIDQV